MILTRVRPSRVKAEKSPARTRYLGIDRTAHTGGVSHLMIPPFDSFKAASTHRDWLRNMRSQVLDQHFKEGPRLGYNQRFPRDAEKFIADLPGSKGLESRLGEGFQGRGPSRVRSRDAK